MTDVPALIETHDLWKIYRRGTQAVQAVRGVNLAVQPGEFVVLLGPSGGGKSTLLHLLGGIDRPTSGRVRVNGSDLETTSEAGLTRFRREHVGFVFQFYNLVPSLNARDNAALPLIARGAGWGSARQRSDELLAQMGLAGRASHKPAELSGGEQQRVAIARALAAGPTLLLADEPTGDLDSANTLAILDLLTQFNRSEGVTVVLATHNTSLTASASHVYEMRDGLLRAHDGGGALGGSALRGGP